MADGCAVVLKEFAKEKVSRKRAGSSATLRSCTHARTVRPPGFEAFMCAPGYAITVVTSRHSDSVPPSILYTDDPDNRRLKRPTHVHASRNTGRAGRTQER
jgi:hypothetical protein